MGITSSASACERYIACPRQWWFGAKAKLYPPSNKAQTLGTELHEALAEYHEHERHPDTTEKYRPEVVRLVLKAIGKQVVRFRPGLLVEHAFSLPLGEHRMKGMIDVLDMEGGVIEDHKTCSNPRYMLSPEGLADDLAMMVYAGALLKLCPALQQPKTIWLRHNYFRTDNLDVTYVDAPVTPDHVRAYWRDRILPVINGMAVTIQQPDIDHIPGWPPSSKACRAYGGCAFTPICHGGTPLEEFSFDAPQLPKDLPF